MYTTFGAPAGALGGSNGAQSGSESRMSTLIEPRNGSDITSSSQTATTSRNNNLGYSVSRSDLGNTPTQSSLTLTTVQERCLGPGQGVLGARYVVELPVGIVVEDQQPQSVALAMAGETQRGHVTVGVAASTAPINKCRSPSSP